MIRALLGEQVFLWLARNDSLSVDVNVVIHMNERGVRNIVVETFQDLISDALTSRVLSVILLLHFVLVVLIEHVGVEDQYRKGNEIRLIYKEKVSWPSHSKNPFHTYLAKRRHRGCIHGTCWQKLGELDRSVGFLWVIRLPSKASWSTCLGDHQRT